MINNDKHMLPVMHQFLPLQSVFEIDSRPVSFDMFWWRWSLCPCVAWLSKRVHYICCTIVCYTLYIYIHVYIYIYHTLSYHDIPWYTMDNYILYYIIPPVFMRSVIKTHVRGISIKMGFMVKEASCLKPTRHSNFHKPKTVSCCILECCHK